MRSNYDRFPHLTVSDERPFCGYDAIVNELRRRITHAPFVLVVETYPGVRDDEVIPALERLEPECFVNTLDLFLPEDEMTKAMRPWLTDDRVFGRMYYGGLDMFLEPEAVREAQRKIAESSGLTVVYGVGASQLCAFDCCVYLDLTRWEIQLRYRAGMANFNCSNHNEDILRKYKRGYFVEWRIADRIKRDLGKKIDYVIDTNSSNDPKMITGEQLFKAIDLFSSRPFRLVPYFDPGVWGGQWMKEHCNLDPAADNYAWSFDGVPEENAILARFGDSDVELPSLDVVFFSPKALLGEKNYARFGAEFPIRFDFLDTMGGGNLSLQVHPTTDYIHSQFGMAYTQDESYYILDAKEDACVYLGVKEKTSPNDMLAALDEAQVTGTFDADAYVNRFPAKKHDHFLIPAGTIHCSGANAMVLEISATPYIFTFKLWDWGRVGLDGRPRPINTAHGAKVIQWDRDTTWVSNNLVDRVTILHEDHDYTEEKTGLHELEFLETRRYTVRTRVTLDMQGAVSVCNLVDGQAARVSSPFGAFEPLEVHYAETFIIPAAAGVVCIEPLEGEIKLLRAYVRGSQCAVEGSSQCAGETAC